MYCIMHYILSSQKYRLQLWYMFGSPFWNVVLVNFNVLSNCLWYKVETLANAIWGLNFKGCCFGSSYLLGKLKKKPLNSGNLSRKMYFPTLHLEMYWQWPLGKLFWRRSGTSIWLSFNPEKNENWRILKTQERFSTFSFLWNFFKLHISIAFVNRNVIL